MRFNDKHCNQAGELSFRFGQTWSETKTLQILLEAFGSTYRSFFLLRRLSLLGLPYCETCLPSRGVHLFLSMLPLRSTLSRHGERETLFPPHDLVIWTDGSVPFPFDKGGSGVLANCSLCGTEVTLFFFLAGPSMFKFLR